MFAWKHHSFLVFFSSQTIFPAWSVFRKSVLPGERKNHFWNWRLALSPRFSLGRWFCLFALAGFCLFWSCFLHLLSPKIFYIKGLYCKNCVTQMVFDVSGVKRSRKQSSGWHWITPCMLQLVCVPPLCKINFTHFSIWFLQFAVALGFRDIQIQRLFFLRPNWKRFFCIYVLVLRVVRM